MRVSLYQTFNDIRYSTIEVLEMTDSDRFAVALAKVVTLLGRNDDVGVRAVGAAMVALYNRQTSDEKISGGTRVQNGRGFSSYDAKRGTYYARWVMKGNRLTGRHLDRARKMARKYRKQLAEETMLTWERRASERAEDCAPTLRSPGVSQALINAQGSKQVLETMAYG